MASVEGSRSLIRRLEAMREPRPVLRAWQELTRADAKKNVRRKTGHLGRSIVAGQITNESATVEARTPYAAVVEEGSRPHIIKPRKAKVLAWGGARRLSGTLRKGAKPTHFARLVHHPGTRPYPYLLPAARKAIGDIRAAMTKLWNDAT